MVDLVYSLQEHFQQISKTSSFHNILVYSFMSVVYFKNNESLFIIYLNLCPFMHIILT